MSVRVAERTDGSELERRLQAVPRPKPVLTRLNGEHVPPSFLEGESVLAQIKADESKLMGSRQQFRRWGKSGIEISDLFENVASHAEIVGVTAKTRKGGHILFYTRSIGFDKAKPIIAKWEKAQPVRRVGDFKTLLVYKKR